MVSIYFNVRIKILINLLLICLVHVNFLFFYGWDIQVYNCLEILFLKFQKTSKLVLNF